MPYAPATPADIQHMLGQIGVADVEDLFADIPAALRFAGELNIPLGVGEGELVAELGRLAARNVDMARETSFLGYGNYDHFVPSVCAAITSRSEFATAYTPYQPEISQGTLQAIFEFQTAICELTGLPVSNASLYDGATAAAEAMYVCEQVVRRSRVLVLRTVGEQVRAVLRTYANAYGMELVEVDYERASGTTSVDEVAKLLDDDTACVIVQQPNVFGMYEDVPGLCEAAEARGAVGVVSCDPLSLGLLEAPGNQGAGIALGDGQALGNHPSFGGPSFGFMAASDRFTRRMPGRIVGETVDAAGERAWVLTLQTREQHIRREKATSNICTNQALNALSGIVYMSWLGPVGLEKLGTLLVDRIERVRERLSRIDGVDPLFVGPAFKELAFTLPIPAAQAVRLCKQRGIHPGQPLAGDYPELGNGALLVAVTEQRTDDDIEQLGQAIEAAVSA
jgi:glycine dehydrogenase subunit 1